jgi:hypothetical protein
LGGGASSSSLQVAQVASTVCVKNLALDPNSGDEFFGLFPLLNALANKEFSAYFVLFNKRIGKFSIKAFCNQFCVHTK